MVACHRVELGRLKVLKYWICYSRTSVSVFLRLQWAFRESVVFWLLSDFLSPVIYFLVWSQVVSVPHQQLATYYVSVILTRQFVEEWIVWAMAPEIEAERFDPQMIKPVSPLIHYFTSNVAHKVFKAPLFILLLLTLVWMRGPSSQALVEAVIYVWTCVVGLVILHLLGYTIAILGFVVRRVTHIYTVVDGLRVLFSGEFAPVIFFPDFLQSAALFSPHWWAIGLPIQIISGSTPSAALPLALVVQFGVAVIMAVVQTWVSRWALNRWAG